MHDYLKLSLTEINLSKVNIKDSQTGQDLPYIKMVEAGKKIFAEQKKNLQNKIKDYILPQIEDRVDLSSAQDAWFPQISDYDIFISHSHANEDLASALAFYINNKFKLKCFIDSLIWGNAFELQKIIDKKYCVEKKDEKGRILTYSYAKRNFTTSHVHLMLNTALLQSMQRAKIFIFLNTPDSINFKDIKDEWTYSPWIYSELSMSKTMFESEKGNINITECVGTTTTIPLIQKVQTSHLKEISLNDLDSFCKKIMSPPHQAYNTRTTSGSKAVLEHKQIK